MKRVTLRIPEAHVKDVDALVDAGEFPNRSEAVRDAVRELLREYGREPEQAFWPEARTDGGTDQPPEFAEELFPTTGWGPKAKENIEKWGDQTPAVLLLALAEEIGEVADEVLATGEKPFHDAMYFAEGVHLLSEVRDVGFQCRDFLEEHFEDADGAPLPEEEMPRIFHDLDEDRVFDEVDDAAPLLFQLSWALNGRDVDAGSNRSADTDGGKGGRGGP